MFDPWLLAEKRWHPDPAFRLVLLRRSDGSIWPFLMRADLDAAERYRAICNARRMVPRARSGDAR